MKDDNLDSDVSRRRWFKSLMALAAAEEMTAYLSGTAGLEAKEGGPTGQAAAVSVPGDPWRHLALMRFAKVQTQLVYVAAKLGIADLLKDGRKSVEELADATGCHAPSLYRLMRALASLGVLMEPEPRHFGLTPVGELLKTDHPRSQPSVTIFSGSEWQCRPHFNTLHSVQTGESAFRYTFGMGVWEYRRQHPEHSALYDAAMTDLSRNEAAAVLDAYDFSTFQTIVDLGGGEGLLLATILEAYPSLRGTILELPSVARAAREFIQKKGLSARCEVIDGDFFKAVPENVDLYILKYIIHGWDDDGSRKILKQCRGGIMPGGRVLIVERLIPADIIV